MVCIGWGYRLIQAYDLAQSVGQPVYDHLNQFIDSYENGTSITRVNFDEMHHYYQQQGPQIKEWLDVNCRLKQIPISSGYDSILSYLVV